MLKRVQKCKSAYKQRGNISFEKIIKFKHVCIKKSNAIVINSNVEYNERVINAVSKKLGYDIEIVESLPNDDNASFDTKTGRLLVSAKSDNPFLVSAIHESVHAIRSIDPKSYNNLVNTVVDILSMDSDVVKSVMGNRFYLYKNEATDENGNINNDLITEEMVAEVTGQLLGVDENMINSLAKSDRNLLKRAYDKVIAFFDKLIERYKGTQDYKMSKEVKDAVKMLENQKDRVLKMYEKALDMTESRQGTTEADTKNILATNTNNKYNENLIYHSRAQRGRSIEIETMENNRFERLRPFYDNLPSKWYAFTRDYFYIYSNQSFMDYTILVKARITNKNRLTIIEFAEELENGIDGSSKALDNWFASFRRGKGRYSWNSIGTTGNTTTSRTNGMDVRTQKRDNIRDIGRSSEYSEIGSEIKLEQENTESIKYSSKKEKWHTDLTKSELKQVENWLRQAGNSESTKITDTANWYKGRIKGQDLFVIYSTENASNPTILYEVKGKNASSELDILFEVMEVYEDGKSTNGKSAYVNWVSGGGWMQKVNGSQNNITNMGREGNNRNAGVLPRQSQRNGSRAFWNVIENLYEIQERRGNEIKYFSRKDRGIDDGAYTETTDNVNLNNAINSLKSNTKNKSEQYGVMWTLDKGILDNNDVSAFYEKISETNNNKYLNFQKASDGQLIYEIGNKLVYTDGVYSYPQISKVVSFNTEDTYLLEYGMESFYDGEKYGYKTDTIVEIVEAVLGEGTVETATYNPYETDKGSEKFSYKRKDSTEINRRSKKDVVEVFLSKKDNKSTYDITNEKDSIGYTQKEYNDYGWARANDILNAGQNKDYRSKFASAVSGQVKFKKTKNGEYIIPVSDIHDSVFEGINNVLVFAKGSIDSPVITSVIEIFEYDETTLDVVRRKIYGLERRGIQQTSGGIIRRYYASDFANEYKGRNLEDGRNSNDNGFRERNSEETFETEERNDKIIYSKQNTESDSEMVKKAEEISLADVSVPPAITLSEEFQAKCDELIEKYGGFKKGVSPARDVSVPKKVSDDKNVRQFTRTAIESSALDDESATRIMEDIVNGEFWTSYGMQSDKKSIKIAETTLEQNGFEKMLSQWEALLESNSRITKQNIVNAQILVREASSVKDVKMVVRLVSELASVATEAGQVVQSMVLIKRLGTAANVYKLERGISALQRELNKKYGEKAPKLKIDDEDLEEYAKAFDAETKKGDGDHRKSDEIAERIERKVAQQLPDNWKDKLNAWRYFAMLANPTTHIRNMLGNLAFAPVVFLKNILFIIKIRHLFVFDMRRILICFYQ